MNGVYVLDDEKYSGHSRWLKEPTNPGEQLICIRVTGGGGFGAQTPKWVIGVMQGGKNGAIRQRYSSVDRSDKPPTNGWVVAGFGGGFGQRDQQALTLTWIDSSDDGKNPGVPLDSSLTLEEWLEAVAPGHGAKLHRNCLALVTHTGICIPNI